MVRFLFIRVVWLFLLLAGISAVSFAVVHLAPGDPVSIQTELLPKVSMEARRRLVSLYGLDRPLWVQYRDWVVRAGRLDFGKSFKDGEEVSSKIAKRIPVTLLINVLSLALILLLAVPLGVIGAARRGTMLDRGISLFEYVGFAVPTFWLALLLISFFGVRLNILPISGLQSLEYPFYSPLEKVIDVARHLVLPVFVSAFTGIAGISRYVRSSMMEVLAEEYIRAARAKGLGEGTVLFRHALRNALLPVVTILGLSVPGLLGGSVIFESIFSIPGMGRLFFDSVYARDFPVIMGILMIGAFLTLAGNLLADLSYFWADPRIRVGKSR